MDLGDLARRVGAYDALEPAYAAWQCRRWERTGRPVPAPSAVKRRVLLEHARANGLRVLVETGTYKADTVRALRRDFDEIHSIEIDESLHRAAVARCRRQGNARLHLGDSARLLGRVVADLDRPALFWLDAHFSGEGTGGRGGHPVVDEVREATGAGLGHVVLVDDAREFGSAEGYPTLDALRDVAADNGYTFEVRDDVVRLVPRS